MRSAKEEDPSGLTSQLRYSGAQMEVIDPSATHTHTHTQSLLRSHISIKSPRPLKHAYRRAIKLKHNRSCSIRPLGDAARLIYSEARSAWINPVNQTLTAPRGGRGEDQDGQGRQGRQETREGREEAGGKGERGRCHLNEPRKRPKETQASLIQDTIRYSTEHSNAVLGCNVGKYKNTLTSSTEDSKSAYI